MIEVFRENGRIFLVFEQLNRTILEELEGRNDDESGIEPLEVNSNIKFITQTIILFYRLKRSFGKFSKHVPSSTHITSFIEISSQRTCSSPKMGF